MPAWLRRVVGLLLVALVVVGIGTTTDLSIGGVPGDAAANGGGRAVAEPTAADGLAELAARADALAAAAVKAADSGSRQDGDGTGDSVPAAGAATGREAQTLAELHTISAMLERHVDLLTPAVPGGGPAPGAAPARATTPPSGPAPDETPARLANALAASGNGLVSESIQAEAAESGALLGAGLEELLAARTLARAAGGTRALASLPAGPEALSDADAPRAAWTEAAGTHFAGGSCGAGATAPYPSPPPPASGIPSLTGSADTDPVPAAAVAADAAYRLSYAYELGAARTGGDAAPSFWRAASGREELGGRLQGLLPASCPPLRRAAYTVPDGFDAAPRTALGAGELQLARALRDSAAAAPVELRTLLVAEAFRAAVAAQDAGADPRLT